MKPKCLNLGCGDDIIREVDKDWINCDMYSSKSDVKCDIKCLPFEDDSVDLVYTSHVIEHFDFKEAFEVLKEWKRVLKPGGIIYMETPDLLASCKKFIASDEQGRISMYGHFFSEPWVNPGMIHKFVYTENQLKWTLERVGFKDIVRKPAVKYPAIQDTCMAMEAKK